MAQVKEVYIMGKKYEVSTYTPVLDGVMNGAEVASGHVNNVSQTIKVNALQPADGIADTVLHEILHAIDYQTQLGLEERQIHVMATALLQTAWDKRNAKLMQMILNP